MTDYLGIYCYGLKKIFVIFCARANPYTECQLQQSLVNSRYEAKDKQPVKRNDDYMIGRLNILRLSHKVVPLPLWLTM